MTDLFLVRHPSEAVLLLRPAGDGTWDSCKRPPVERKKAKNILRYGPDGWVLVDDSSGHSGAVLYRPAGGAAQERAQPPLGPWRRVPVGKESGEECTLTDVEPICAKLTDPKVLQAPFADISVEDTGDVVRIEAALKRTAITDASFDALLKKFKELLLGLVQRPRVILMLQLSMLDAAVPSMRHVKQFMSFVSENSWAINTLVRGCAVVLKSQGYSSYAMLNIVKMVLRLLPAPWQTGILPTVEEGRAFLDNVTVAEAQLLARHVVPSGTPCSAPGEKSSACEATPTTMEERSLISECSAEETPHAIGEQSPQEPSPRRAATAQSEEEVETPCIERGLSCFSVAARPDDPKTVEVELEEGALASEPRSCWGTGWLFAYTCAKP